MSRTYLLEIGSDEIPARYLPSAIEDLGHRAREALELHQLHHGEIRTYGSPRRLALLVSDLAERSEDVTAKVRGPSKKASFGPDGAPTKALLGFCRSIGISIDDVMVEGEEGAQYIWGEKRTSGRPAAQVLLDAMPNAVLGLPCPYPMRWGEGNWRWFRPIRWVLSLYGEEVVPVQIAGRVGGRLTWGHRTLHPGSVTIDHADGYLQALDGASVQVDPKIRRRIIEEGAIRLASTVGGTPAMGEERLRETLAIAEHPSVFLGHFDEGHLSLPEEVLVASMWLHQRYFPLHDPSGTLIPAFIGIRDGHPTVGMDRVRQGNEWVLRARLEDAAFFHEQDEKHTLVRWLPLLSGVSFVRNAGTMLDKAHRMEKIASHLAEVLGFDEGQIRASASAGLLAKADLVSALVGEFPELEGVMGGIYARQEGLPDDVSRAIGQHYLPRGLKDELPEAGPPSMVALADKLDLLAVCFSLGIDARGSHDPLGLRRAALGTVAIALDRAYDLSWEDLLDLPLELASSVVAEPSSEARLKMSEFLMARAEAVLVDEGYPADIVRAVQGGGERRLRRHSEMCRALHSRRDTEGYGQLLLGWKRVGVLSKAGEGTGVDESLLAEEAERVLYQEIGRREERLSADLEAGRYGDYLGLLCEIVPFVDECLNQVLIMAEDGALRANRLALLGLAASLWSAYAEFSSLK